MAVFPKQVAFLRDKGHVTLNLGQGARKALEKNWPLDRCSTDITQGAKVKSC